MNRFNPLKRLEYNLAILKNSNKAKNKTTKRSYKS